MNEFWLWYVSHVVKRTWQTYNIFRTRKVDIHCKFFFVWEHGRYMKYRFMMTWWHNCVMMGDVLIIILLQNKLLQSNEIISKTSCNHLNSIHAIHQIIFLSLSNALWKISRYIGWNLNCFQSSILHKNLRKKLFLSILTSSICGTNCIRPLFHIIQEVIQF